MDENHGGKSPRAISLVMTACTRDMQFKDHRGGHDSGKCITGSVCGFAQLSAP